MTSCFIIIPYSMKAINAQSKSPNSFKTLFAFTKLNPYIAINITNVAKTVLLTITPIPFNLKYFLEYDNTNIKVRNSEITDAIDAPTALYFGIKSKLLIKFITIVPK